MTTTTRSQNRYDHRIRELVRTTRDIKCVVQMGVPPSTARGWLTSTTAEVITSDVLDMKLISLQREVLQLRARVRKLTALLRVLFAVMRVCGCSLNHIRLSDGKDKKSLLRSIDRARGVYSLRSLLRSIRLSASRYHNWRKEQCELDDMPSCPRHLPHQLMDSEIDAIRDFVTCDAYRHVPTGTLARLAQRIGKVFASASTWYRLVRDNNWRRPRQRVHPAKPKVGIRASRPNEIWHVDTTLIRLLDGSRAYLHAVIDNFSRRVLAWKIADKFEPGSTADILRSASQGQDQSQPTLLADGGIENRNTAVDELIHEGVLKRVLARTEITFSNSLIESWWRVLKHHWLYLNTLDSVASVEKLVAFYVREHNSRLPHSAFAGQTPDEMYFQTGGHIPEQLESARRKAREKRALANRQRTCKACQT